MTPIKSYPPGKVISSVRLQKDETTVDIVRIKSGARTMFVESVYRQGLQVAFRKTDDFPSDAIADRYYEQMIRGKVENEEYKIVLTR